MPKPAITTFSSVAVNPSSTNKNNGLYPPQLTQEQINAIPDDTARNGGLVYNSKTLTLDVRLNDAWVPLGVGGNGDVVGPGVSVDGNIVTFDGTTGKLIKDSGVSITAVPAPPLALNSFRSEKATASLVDVNQIGNLGNIQFVNDIGLIFVDSLLPLEFITNDIGGEDQVCSLFTGGLPSSSTTPSALVELQTSTGALVLSRLTEVEKDALFSTEGMLLFNKDTKKLDINNGTTWSALATNSDNDNFASELYLSTNFIEDAVEKTGSEFAWSPTEKILLRSCIVGGGATSTVDGVTWQTIAAFPFASSCVARSGADTNFVATELGGTGFSSSADGLTWAISKDAGVSFTGKIRYSNSSLRFYIGNSDVGKRIYSSPNGVFFDGNTSDREARDFASGNDITVSVGGNGPQYITAANAGALVWTNSSSTISMEAVTFSPELGYFVAIPRNVDHTSTYTSIDGVNWTTHADALSNNASKRFIVWIPVLSMFICGGDNEFFAISHDGITFQQVEFSIIGSGSASYGAIYVKEWGELLIGRNASSLTRTAKRFIY